MANEKEVTTEVVTKKNPNSKFVGFDVDRARCIETTKDGFFTIQLFKEMRILFELNVKTIDPQSVKKAIINSTNHVISLVRTRGIEKFVDDEAEINIDGSNVAITLMIPFSRRQDMIVQSLTRMVENLNKEQEDVRYKVFQKNIAMFNINQGKQASGKVFIKGYVAGSHETIIKKKFVDDKPVSSKFEKTTLRAQTFLNDYVWSGEEQMRNVRNYSRYSLCLNRLNVYSQTEGKVITNSIPFKRSFKVIIYQISDDGVLTRNNVTVSLCLNQNEGAKRKVAVGVFLENVETTKNISDFNKDIFYENEKFLLTENPYLHISDTVPEVDIFKNDLYMIQDDIFSELKFNPSENQNEPKKGGKKSGKKKKETEEVKEEDVKNDHEEGQSFNDVGTLCDAVEEEVKENENE